MSLLDDLPHTATAYIRIRRPGPSGGNRDTYTVVFQDRACWQQPASDSQITEYQKRGVTITDKVYFTIKPLLDERHVMDVYNEDTGDTIRYDVMSSAEPDASAGLGILYRVMVNRTTTV